MFTEIFPSVSRQAGTETDDRHRQKISCPWTYSVVAGFLTGFDVVAWRSDAEYLLRRRHESRNAGAGTDPGTGIVITGYVRLRRSAARR